jgi:prolyl oligopeptidase PreP (S9A serine peptidase family)
MVVTGMSSANTEQQELIANLLTENSALKKVSEMLKAKVNHPERTNNFEKILKSWKDSQKPKIILGATNANSYSALQTLDKAWTFEKDTLEDSEMKEIPFSSNSNA